MTTDETIEKVIEAIARALCISDERSWEGNSIWYMKRGRATFFAQHGIVRVVPIEATREMCHTFGLHYGDADEFNAMAAEGDLTKGESG